jgi:hypothetical protein
MNENLVKMDQKTNEIIYKKENFIQLFLLCLNYVLFFLNKKFVKN